MKEKKIKISNVQPYAPTTFTAICYLMADKFNSQILWGVLGTIVAIMWIGWAITVANSEIIDLFKEEKGDKKDGSKKS